MQTFLLAFTLMIGLVFSLYPYNGGPPRWVWLGMLLASVLMLPRLALADAGTDPGGAFVPDLQHALTAALTATAIAGIAWITKHAGGWLGNSKAVQAAQKEIHDFNLDEKIAAAAAHFAAAQEAKLGTSDWAQRAKKFLKAHDYVDDGLDRMLLLAESKAAEAATHQLSIATATISDDLEYGDLAKGIAILERQQDAARAAQKLPPAPAAGGAK